MYGGWQLATKTKFKDSFESELGYLTPLPSLLTCCVAGMSMGFFLSPQSLLILDYPRPQQFFVWSHLLQDPMPHFDSC